MKRKLLALCCSLAVMLMTMSTGVFAAGSPTQQGAANVTVENGDNGSVSLTHPSVADWSSMAGQTEALELINNINNNSVEPQASFISMVGSNTVYDFGGNERDISSYKYLSPVYSVNISADQAFDNGTFGLSWTQPELVNLASASSVLILGFDLDKQEWVLITPNGIDPTTGTIYANVPRLGALTLIYSDSVSDITPIVSGSTGNTITGQVILGIEDYSMWIGCVLIAVGVLLVGCVAVLVIRKRSR